MSGWTAKENGRGHRHCFHSPITAPPSPISFQSPQQVLGRIYDYNFLLNFDVTTGNTVSLYIMWLSWYEDGLRAELLEFDSRGGIFLVSTESRPSLGPTQSPIQWILEALTREYSFWGVKLTTHLHLMPRSRMSEQYPHSSICLHGTVLN
jgi:hypothetical protein